MSFEHRFFIDAVKIEPEKYNLKDVMMYAEWRIVAGTINPEEPPNKNFKALAEVSGTVLFDEPDPEKFVEISKVTIPDVRSWVDAKLDYPTLEAEVDAKAAEAQAKANAETDSSENNN